MDYYEDTGELFNVSRVDQDEKRMCLQEQIECFLIEHGAYPDIAIMRITEDNSRTRESVDQDLFDVLSDALASICPPHYYYGENRHDPGIYGFWPVPALDNWEVPS